jgi:hypothetical protein
MSAVASAATVPATSAPRAVRPGWLWLSLPITVLAFAGSLAGILVGDIYAEETADWAGQAVGQDIANLFLYPLLLGLAYLAARGSLRAYLVFVAHPEEKTWWRNLRKGAEVEVRLRGDRLRGQAAVASDAAVASTYLDRYPRARAAIRAAEPATFVRIRELEPSPGRLHKDVSGNVR